MATSKDKLLQAFLRQQGKPRKRKSPVSPPPGGVRTRQTPGTVTVEKHGPRGFYDMKVTTDSLYQSPGSRKKPQFGALPAGGRSLIQPRKGRSDANVSLKRMRPSEPPRGTLRGSQVARNIGHGYGLPQYDGVTNPLKNRSSGDKRKKMPYTPGTKKRGRRYRRGPYTGYATGRGPQTN